MQSSAAPGRLIPTLSGQTSALPCDNHPGLVALIHCPPRPPTDARRPRSPRRLQPWGREPWHRKHRLRRSSPLHALSSTRITRISTPLAPPPRPFRPDPASGGLLLGLLALCTSHDPISDFQRTIPIQQQWGRVASLATVVVVADGFCEAAAELAS